jgi:hypothetical protein
MSILAELDTMPTRPMSSRDPLGPRQHPSRLDLSSRDHDDSVQGLCIPHTSRPMQYQIHDLLQHLLPQSQLTLASSPTQGTRRHTHAHATRRLTLANAAHTRPSECEICDRYWTGHDAIPFQQFQVLFHSLFKVLFIFPSRYLFAIGLAPIFSFRWNLPPLGAAFPSNSTPRRRVVHARTPGQQRESHPPCCPLPRDLAQVAALTTASPDYNSPWSRTTEISSLSSSRFTRRY